MEELVSLDEAKAHLKLSLSITADDDDLQRKLEQAQAAVIDIVSQRRSGGTEWAAEVAAWTDETAPEQVKAAIYWEFGYRHRHRGDDGPDEEPKGDSTAPLCPQAMNSIRRLYDPAIA